MLQDVLIALLTVSLFSIGGLAGLRWLFPRNHRHRHPRVKTALARIKSLSRF